MLLGLSLCIAGMVLGRAIASRRHEKFVREYRHCQTKAFELGVRQGAVGMFNSLKQQGIIPEWIMCDVETITVAQPSGTPKGDQEFLKSLGVKF
jgi:hypothetical protein